MSKPNIILVGLMAVGKSTVGRVLADGMGMAFFDSDREIERLVKARLSRIQATDPRLGDIRGRGAMIAVELVDPTTGAPDPRLAREVALAAHRQGVIVLTCGTFGNVLRFLPPLTIDDALLDDAFDVLASAFGGTR